MAAKFDAPAKSPGKKSRPPLTPAGFLIWRPVLESGLNIEMAGEHLKEINLVLTREPTISGRVLDEDGDPVANITVRLQFGGGLNSTTGGAAFTDGSGKYTIPGPNAGRYYLSASMGNDRAFSIWVMRAVESLASDRPGSSGQPTEFYATTFYPNEKDRRAAAPIQIIAGQDAPGMDIHLQKTPAFAVRGKVVGVIPWSNAK
jgi:hypothetical protein